MPQDNYAKFWEYLPQEQKDLILQGEYLVNTVVRHKSFSFQDYSFVIFPYAKAYEGFLKLLFKDVGFISHLDFISDHLRLGKLMSPNLMGRLRERSLYKKIRENASDKLAERIWRAWKDGRNQIFHYFPHNLKAVSLSEAEEIIKEIIATMEEAYLNLKDIKYKPQTIKT